DGTRPAARAGPARWWPGPGPRPRRPARRRGRARRPGSSRGLGAVPWPRPPPGRSAPAGRWPRSAALRTPRARSPGPRRVGTGVGRRGRWSSCGALWQPPPTRVTARRAVRDTDRDAGGTRASIRPWGAMVAARRDACDGSTRWGRAARSVRHLMNVHLVDGTYELFRYHFAPNNRDPDRGATAGVLATLLQLVEDGATHVGVATDHVIESFRNDLWPGYKSSVGMPPELLAQFPLAEEAMASAGFAVWPQVVHEADDALATAALMAAEDPRVEQVVICTPDKDLGQCVRGQ